MKIERTVTTFINESVLRERITNHMSKRGFKQKGDKLPLTFRRGSIGIIHSSLSPEEWYCEAKVDFIQNGESEIVIKFKVNTKWQIVLPWERAFWNSEVKDLEESILYGDKASIESVKSEKRANLLNLAVSPLAVILIVAVVSSVAMLPAIGIGISSQKIFHITESDSVLVGLGTWWSLLFITFYVWYKKYSKPNKRR